MTPRRTPGSEQGIVLVAALLVLMLISALMAGMFAAVTSDQRGAMMDRDQTQAYAAAHAGLEEMTSGLASLFTTDVSPSTTAINAVAATPPSIPGFEFRAPGGAAGSGYTITYTDANNDGAHPASSMIGGLPGASHLDIASSESLIEALAGYGIRYVLLAPGAPSDVVPTLDGEPGLRRLSNAEGTTLWRVAGTTARARVVSRGKPEAVGIAENGRVTADPYIDQEVGEGAGRILVSGAAADGSWSARTVAEDGSTSPLTATAGAWFERRRALALGLTAAGSGLGTLVLSPTTAKLIDA